LSGTSSTNQKYEEVMRIALEEASSILPQRYIVMLLQDSGIMARGYLLRGSLSNCGGENLLEEII